MIDNFTYIGISLWDSSTVVSLYSIISITLTSSRLLHQSFSLCLDDGVCYVNDTHVENFFVLRHTAYPHYEGRSHPSLYYIWVDTFPIALQHTWFHFESLPVFRVFKYPNTYFRTIKLYSSKDQLLWKIVTGVGVKIIGIPIISLFLICVILYWDLYCMYSM